MTTAVNAIAFWLLAAACVGSALGMLTTRNIVHAAYYLLSSMLATAGVYFVLNADFVALVQIMVYAGAVSVLLIFAIMLTLRRREDAIRSRDFSMQALVLALLFAGALIVALRDGHFVVLSAATFPGIVDFGRELFSTWLLPFETASLLLTVALVGAVWWSGTRRHR